VDFVFDIDKTIAAAGFLTKREGGTISIFVLMKMMYGAEREALAKWKRPITGDSFFCMKKGIILSRTYDLIKRSISSSNSDMEKWSRFFSARIANQIQLISQPELGFLSQWEMEALQNSFDSITTLIKEKGLIADELHKRWPEWTDPGRGALPLSLNEVLREVVEDDSQIEKIILEIKAVASAKAALQISS